MSKLLSKLKVPKGKKITIAKVGKRWSTNIGGKSVSLSNEKYSATAKANYLRRKRK